MRMARTFPELVEPASRAHRARKVAKLWHSVLRSPEIGILNHDSIAMLAVNSTRRSNRARGRHATHRSQVHNADLLFAGDGGLRVRSLDLIDGPRGELDGMMPQTYTRTRAATAARWGGLFLWPST